MAAPRRRSRGGAGLGWPVDGLAILAALTLGLPVLVLIARALLDGSLASSLGLRVVIDALVLSLVTTTVCLVLTVAAGTPLALLLARRRFRGQALLETAIDLPIVLPPSVAGLSLLLVFGRRGLLGEPLTALGIEIPFTVVAVVIAQAFVSAPFYIRSARTGFASVDHDLEDAARVDGGGAPAVPADHDPARVRVAGRGPRHGLGAGARRVWRHDHVRGQCRGPDPDAAARRLRRVPGRRPGRVDRRGRDPRPGGVSGVLVSVRILHAGRVLDVRGAS